MDGRSRFLEPVLRKDVPACRAGFAGSDIGIRIAVGAEAKFPLQSIRMEWRSGEPVRLNPCIQPDRF